MPERMKGHYRFPLFLGYFFLPHSLMMVSLSLAGLRITYFLVGGGRHDTSSRLRSSSTSCKSSSANIKARDIAFTCC